MFPIWTLILFEDLGKSLSAKLTLYSWNVHRGTIIIFNWGDSATASLGIYCTPYWTYSSMNSRTFVGLRFTRSFGWRIWFPSVLLLLLAKAAHVATTYMDRGFLFSIIQCPVYIGGFSGYSFLYRSIFQVYSSPWLIAPNYNYLEDSGLVVDLGLYPLSQLESFHS